MYPRIKRAYTYQILSQIDVLPLDFIGTIINYLKLDDLTPEEEQLVVNITLGVLNFIEKYTKRTLLTKNFRTYRDYFPGYDLLWGCYEYDYIELKKSPFQQLENFTYINTDNVSTAVPASIYYTTLETDYSKILANPGEQFPQDVICKLQSIQIDFKAGYGDSIDDIPYEILLAIYQLVADLYYNRGDCASMSASTVSCSCLGLLTANSKGLLEPYRLLSLW